MKDELIKLALGDQEQEEVKIIEEDNSDVMVGTPDIRFEGDCVPFNNVRFIHNGSTIDELMGNLKPNDDIAFVIIADGGVGDQICATPMIASAKKFYPNKKIIVGSSHHEVLINNPNIDVLYSLGFPTDLFDKWVKPLRHFGSVVKRDIYNVYAHKLFPGPLSSIWCHLYGVPFYGDDIKIYLSEQEDEEAIKFLKTFPREVVFIHGTGAKLTFNPSVQITPNKDYFPEMWAQIAKELSKDFDIVQLGGKEEQAIEGVTTYLMGQTNLRQSAALLKHGLTYIAIDSFVNHCGPAVGKAGVVLFGRSNPYIAGHSMNKSIWVKGSCEFNDHGCGRPSGYFGDAELFRGQMRPWVCPSRSCMRAIKPSKVLEVTYDLIKQMKRNQK